MKTAICAIIKDEHLFLKEWIDWHLSLGFDAIHLFEDKGSDSHEEITKDYDKVILHSFAKDTEVQEVLKANGSSARQLVLYNWFGDTYKEQYNWIAFIDLDEFIMFNDNYSLDKLCEEFEPYSTVLLNWRIMGASGHIKRPTRGVMEAYTKEEPPMLMERNYMYKSFCNMKRWLGFSAYLHLADGYVNTNHRQDTHEWCYDKAWINHYFTKSWEDWCSRIFSRGDTQNGHRLLCDFFDANPSMREYEEILVNSVIQQIPNGTHKVKRGSKLIAGGNVSAIEALNGYEQIDAVDYVGKRILLIGNKPQEQMSDEQIALINSYDVIVRCNGMNNIEQTGGRVDWWWLNVWNWNALKENLGKRDYSSAKLVMIDNNSSRLVTSTKLCDNLPMLGRGKQIWYTKQDSTRLCKQPWESDETCTVPTTDIICLSYLVNKFPFSEITLACLDVEEREELFKTHSNWCNTWHKNVGGFERDYIKGLIKENKIKWLEL